MPRHRRIIRRRTGETDEEYAERKRRKDKDDRLTQWLKDAHSTPDWALPPGQRRGE